jgi:hypothetical protein
MQHLFGNDADNLCSLVRLVKNEIFPPQKGDR